MSFAQVASLAKINCHFDAIDLAEDFKLMTKQNAVINCPV